MEMYSCHYVLESALHGKFVSYECGDQKLPKVIDGRVGQWFSV